MTLRSFIYAIMLIFVFVGNGLFARQDRVEKFPGSRRVIIDSGAHPDKDVYRPAGLGTSGKKETFKVNPCLSDSDLHCKRAKGTDTSITMTAVKDSVAGGGLDSSRPAELQDVTIHAASAFIERKLDRVVMNIAHSSLKNEGSAFHVLKYAPGVFIQNGEIILNGHQIAGILVNDRKLNLAGQALWAYLSSLKTSEIAAIQIIAQPPATYDAEGGGGLINIILKKHTTAGLKGDISMSYLQGIGKYPDYSPSFDFNYYKNKLGITGGVSYEYYKTFYDITQSRTLTAVGADYLSLSENIMNIDLNSQRIGLFYDISPAQYIGFDFMHVILNNRNLTGATVSLKGTDNSRDVFSDGTYSNISHTDLSDISGNYVYNMDTLGSKFKVLVNITSNKAGAVANNAGQSLDDKGNLLSDTVFKYHYPNTVNIYTAETGYTRVYAPGSELSMGGKISVTKVANRSSTSSYTEHIWKEEPATKSDYTYKEQIYAGYLNFKGSAVKVEYQIGLRGEYSKVSGQISGSLNQDTINNQNYFNLFPTVYIKKHLHHKMGNYFLFSYGRRIGRPSFLKLMPFKYFFDNYTTREGNPSLSPQFTDSWELGYTLKNKYDIKLGYSRTGHLITQLMEFNQNTPGILMIYRNIGTFEDKSLTLSFPLQIKNWWSLNNRVQAGYIRTAAPSFDIHQFYLNVQTFQDFTVSKTVSVNLNGNYRYGEVWANSVSQPFGSLDITIRKKMLNGKLTGSVGLSDILYTGSGNTKRKQLYNGADIDIIERSQSRYLNMSLIYNFSLGGAVKTKHVEQSNGAEKKRL